MAGSSRSSSLEILRVVSMLLVVLTHVCIWGTTVNGGTSASVTFANGGVNSYVYVILQSLSALGVICFVLITSYFICESNVLRIDRILKVWTQTFFYSLLMAIISSLFVTVTLKQILLSLAPVASGQYWFVTNYLGLIVLSPILSHAVNALSKRGFFIALISLAVITMSISFGFPYGNEIFGGSFSIGTFILLFFIAAYLRKHGIPGWLSKYCGRIFLFCILFQVAGGYVVNLVRDGSANLYGGFSVGYNALSVLPATALFVLFLQRDIKANKFNRLLVAIAPYTFATYLIHDNQYFREVLWGKLLNLPECWSSALWSLLAIAVPIAILIICTGVDFLRSTLFKVARIDKLMEKAKKLNFQIS